MRTKAISDYKLNKLLKDYSPKKLIYKYIEREIILTSKQLDRLILLDKK